MRKSLLCAMAIMIAIVLIVGICLTGCSDTLDTNTNKQTEHQQNKLVLVEKFYIEDTFNNLYTYIVYDKDTKVMYAFIDENNSGGLTPLYNADGSLMLYNGQ